MHGHILQKSYTTMQIIEDKITQKYMDEHKYFKPLVDGLTDIKLNTNLTNITLLCLEVKPYLQMHKFILQIVVWKRTPLYPMHDNRCNIPYEEILGYLKQTLHIY